MADTTTVVEGKVKYRDGRKWKQRWCVLKKPSPVADRLQVLLYKDVKDAIKDGSKPKSCFPIESFYGLQSGFSYDKENNVVAIICQKQVILFSFENWEDLIQFEIQIRRNLGEEHQFRVQIAKMPSHSKLPNAYVKMLIHGQKFCLTSHAPPKLLQSWHISDLRRFGTVDGKFLFEGGSRCNKGAGFHAIKSDQSVEIGEIINLASLGKISSCQRNANKRGSHFSEAFDSFNTFSNFFNNNQPRMGGDRANVLNCCNDNNLQDIDEMGWHKRHSISVMDYRRMAELTEKFKLISMEKLERQRMLAVYDIPPKSVREVGYQKSVPVKNLKKPNTNRYSVSCSELKSGNSELSRILSDSLSQSYSTHVYSNAPFQKGYSSSSPTSPTVGDASGENINLNFHYSHCYQKNKMLTINPLCIIEDEARTAFDRSKRLEAMQKLQKQECDLHKEISLLDEILQVCKTDDPQTDAQIQSSEFSFTERASSLPNKGQQECWNENSLTCKNYLSAESCTKSSSHTDLHHCKPFMRTKISAPLPYVNLSQFDVGDDNGLVHLSKEGLVTGSNSSKSPLPRHSTPKKLSTESISSRSSTDSHTGSSINQTCAQEPIYVNETRNDYDLKPPELPPKGQALLRKNKLSRNSSSFSQSSNTPPPLPPSRNRSRSVGSQGKGSFKEKADGTGSNSKIYSIDQVVSPPSRSNIEDTYLMMGSFQDEGKHTKISTSLEWADTKRTSKGNADIMNCYMDMAAFFQKESSSGKTPESDNNSPIYDTIDNSVESGPIAPIRESNYMIMDVAKSQRRSTSEESQSTAIKSSHESNSPLCTKRSSVIQRLQTLQNYVSTTRAGEENHNGGSIVIPKPIMPFQNLIGFKPQNVRSAGVYINSVNANVEETSNSPEPASKKEEGFLARFKRRKSQDQSKACQSTENLLYNSKSSRMSVLEKSFSENGETTQNTHVKTTIRQRSSSFPNRRSFQEDETDTTDMVNQSCKSESLTDDVFPQWKIEEQQSPTKESHEIKENDYSESKEKKEIQVLTVLHVQHQTPVQNIYTQFGSSKTDDEKMIEMLHIDKKKMDKKSNYALISELKSKLSLSFTKDVSNITGEPPLPSLPPFLPPKSRVHPTLSPVVELTPSTPQLPAQESIYVEMKEPAAKLSSRTQSLDKSLEDNDNSGDQNEDHIPNFPNKSNLSGAAQAYERALQTLQKNRIVIIVEDFKERLEKDDNASLSSNDYPETCSLESTGSVCGDSYTCSPAKTVLRPRSGREYTVVQRCKKQEESSRLSPCSSPTSPVSVFTFDIHDPYLNTIEGRGTISSPASKLSSKSDDSAPSSPWIPLPQRCFKKKLDLTPTEAASVRLNSVSYSDNASGERHHSSSIPKSNSPLQKSSSTLRKKSEKKRTSSTRSQPDPGNYHKSTDHYVNLPAHDSDNDGMNLRLHPKNESVAYSKNKNDSEYLRLWDDKPSTSRSPKASVSSDNSPPSTPLNPLLAPLTPIDDEHVLMYVEIDLEPSESTPKPKKPVPKSSKNLGVEYTNIDLVATKALKAAGEVHAQDRTDSLRRSRSMKYPPLSHHSSFRDRKESTSSRNRKFSASAIEFRA